MRGRNACSGYGLAIYLLVPLAPSCTSYEERLCRADARFCENGWENKLGGLSAEELFKLDLRHAAAVHGGNAVIEGELARRGAPAIEAMLDPSVDAARLEFDTLWSNLNQVRASTGIDGCAPPYRDRFVRLLRDTDEAVDEATAERFKSLCELK